MVQETWVQSQVESYQKWYLIPPCLTLSNIRYVSREKWSNPGKGVVPTLHLGVVAIEKGAFWSPSTMVANFTYFWLICKYWINLLTLVKTDNSKLCTLIRTKMLFKLYSVFIVFISTLVHIQSNIYLSLHK